MAAASIANLTQQNKSYAPFIQYKKPIPSLATMTQDGPVLFVPKPEMVNAQKKELSLLYYRKIRKNEAIGQAPPGIYTWIMKSANERINVQERDRIDMYAVKTCTKQEIGTIHLNLDMLTRAYDQNPNKIVAAGELVIQVDGSIHFNLLSGSYMWDKRSAWLKIYSTNTRTLKSLGSKKKNANNQERIQRATEKMFQDIAEHATIIIQRMTGAPHVTFLASADSAGGQNLIGPETIPLQPENDPILCEYFDRISAVDMKVLPTPSIHKSIQHRGINKSHKQKLRRAMSKLRSLHAFSSTKKNPRT